MQPSPSILCSLSLLLLGLTATAQCTPQWQAGDPVPYVRGSVSSMVTWDPDGAGPLLPRLVVGGKFDVGTSTLVSVAAYDGSQWTPFGSVGPVNCLCDWNGLLVAASAGFGGDGVFAWTGTTWQSLGATSGSVFAMCSYNGSLYVGGYFTTAGGLPAYSVARWSGSGWSPLGSGISQGVVRSMAVFNNLLYIGGNFNNAGGVAAGNMAAWNGSAWLPTAAFNGPVAALGVRTALSLSQHQLFAAGSFTSVGSTPAQHVARFTTSGGWSAMGGGVPGTDAVAISVANTGVSSFDLAVAVDAPGSTQMVWRWNGTGWTSLGNVVDSGGNWPPTSLGRFNGQVVVGLDAADQNVRRYDGVANWPPLLGPGLAGRVLAIDADGSDLVVGGSFPTISGVAVNHIARGGPGNWQPLGTGVEASGAVSAVARTGNGDVVAGGTFAAAGGVAAANIARWNGTAWSPLGAGLNGTVNAIRVLANGDLIATGAFIGSGTTLVNHIARWNGTTWSALGLGLGAPGHALALAANGDLVVGGQFQTAGGLVCNRIARWNGTSWSALGAGFDDTVFALAVLPNGAIAAGGRFQNSAAVACRYVAVWDGSAWTPRSSLFFKPDDDVFALVALPGGDFIAGGVMWSYLQTNPLLYIESALARHSSVGWQSLRVSGPGIRALARRPNGTVVAGGEFHLNGSLISDNVAQWVPPCPATAAGYGAGCTGSGGANVLTATELPWLGGSYRGLATGMPALGFAVTVTGLGALAVPIAAILPQGLPGCSALVTPDLLDLAIPSAGRVATQLAIPPTSTLVGLQFRQQVVPFDSNLAGAVLAITSTNALLLTIGVL
jgi:hypothetical protein